MYLTLDPTTSLDSVEGMQPSLVRGSWLLLLPTLAFAAHLGCGTEPDSNFQGDGTGSSSSGEGGGGSSGIVPDDASGNNGDGGTSSGKIGEITVTVRDFQHWVEGDATRNPDFENIPTDKFPPEAPNYWGPWTESTDDYGAVNGDGTVREVAPEYRVSIVMPELGADNKPVYNESNRYKSEDGRTATTHGKAAFDQWFHDAPGVNRVLTRTLTLSDQGNGTYTYDSAVSGVPRGTDGVKQFFPIDGDGFGNTPAEITGDPALQHNYHFTMELHTVFTYAGDETFRFTGDDDIFVYVNKKLVINIGGIHGVAQKEVKLAELAPQLGLEIGKEYPFDLFQAERHVTGSNVRLDTTIKLRPIEVH